MASRLRPPSLILGCTLILLGCGPTRWEPRILPEGAAIPSQTDAPYLKAHLQSGEMVLFSDWAVPTEGETSLEGYGFRYGRDRSPLEEGVLLLPLDSIALLEANRKETVSRFAFTGLTVYTVSSTVVTALCVMDPKACFGSCPTFYLGEEGEGEELVAEGFSSSVARAFEASDVDALPRRAFHGPGVSLLMRNEAPETHAVRSLRLLAARPSPGQVVHAISGGGFREGSTGWEPTRCRVLDASSSGDCSSLVGRADGLEYLGEADSTDLAAREWMELEFPEVSGEQELGLLLRGRASLLSTFLFYQTLAYAGEEAGAILASLERGDPALASSIMGMPDALGDVDVYVDREGEWVEVGHFGEAGPIAMDEQVVPLPVFPSGPVRVRLSMAKGAWKLDRIGLVGLREEIEPQVILPTRVETVFGDLSPEVALRRLTDPEEHLVTQQGDAFRVHFDLPEGGPGWSLFLESRGFYYEWMRGEWLREGNLEMAYLILSDPRGALRMLAPTYKAREGEMEKTFWASRFRRMEK